MPFVIRSEKRATVIAVEVVRTKAVVAFAYNGALPLLSAVRAYNLKPFGIPLLAYEATCYFLKGIIL